jgi:hypothetical protein
MYNFNPLCELCGSARNKSECFETLSHTGRGRGEIGFEMIIYISNLETLAIIFKTNKSF